MFESSKLKLQRAEKHILELYNLMQSFADADLYSITLEADSQYRIWELGITVHKSKKEFANETALIIGDVYHNLRSGLDILWFEIVSPTGSQTKWTRFPIEDTEEEVITRLSSALGKGQITKAVHDLVLDELKPYPEGNFRLWAIHETNIIDKHQLLIPNFPMIAIEGVRVQNDKNVIFDLGVIYTDSSCQISLSQSIALSPNVELIDKGHASYGHGFDLGNPHEGAPVIPTLNAVAKEVANTIGAFESLLG